MKAQIEVLRKMLLAMVEDIRVVLLRLASRTQTLRFYAHPDDLRVQVARETLELYSPLANRLGVWELKWELEDLSFRFIHPDTYKKIAKMLDEKRSEREQFIVDAVAKVRGRTGGGGRQGPKFTAGRSTSTASGTRCARKASSSPRSTTCAPCASSSTT
jgi:GTP pyrophosphokinase